MKKLLLLFLSIIVVLCLFGCDNEESPAGGGNSEITGSLAYFYGEGETAIEVFYSEDKENKEITLSKENAYTIGLRPSFRGSKEAIYNGDCATFSFADGCCEIIYIGEENSQPIYKIQIKRDADFDLTISVDNYSQTIRIVVAESTEDGGDQEDEKLSESYFEVIGSLEISDIQKVETKAYSGSISPIHRPPVENKVSTLNTDVEAVYTWLKDLENNITPIADQELPGGSSVCLTVNTSLGTLVIWQNADKTLLIGENYYSQTNTMPVIAGEMVTYSFESYLNDADYFLGEVALGTVTLDFEEILCIISDEVCTEAKYKLNSDFGKLTVYDSKHFMRNGIIYEIVSDHLLPELKLPIFDAQIGVVSTVDRGDDLTIHTVYFKVEIPYTTYYTVTANSHVKIYNQLLENGSVYRSGESFALPKGTWYFEVSFYDVSHGDTPPEFFNFFIEPKGAIASLGNETVISYHTNNFYCFESPNEANYTISTRGDANNNIEAVITVKKLSNGIWTDICCSEKSKFPSLSFDLLEGERIFISVDLIGEYDQAFIMGIDYTDASLRKGTAPIELSLQTENYLLMQKDVDKNLAFTPERSGEYKLRAELSRNEKLTITFYENGVLRGSYIFDNGDSISRYHLLELELQRDTKYDFVLSFEHPTSEISEIRFVIDKKYEQLSANIAKGGTTAYVTGVSITSGGYERYITLEKGGSYRYAMFGDGEYLFNTRYTPYNGDNWCELPEDDLLLINEDTEEGFYYFELSRYKTYGSSSGVAELILPVIKVVE